MKKIFVISGEQSGDNILYYILKNIDPEELKNYSIEAIAGDKSFSLGVKKFAHISDISVMGFVEVIPKLFKLLKLIKDISNYIIENKPDIVITIDSPDFSLRIVKKCYDMLHGKTKFFHVVAPTVWAYREYRAQQLSKICDHLFCLFPFEPPYFTKYKLKTSFIGHYIFNMPRDLSVKRGNIIVIMPGSRSYEIKKHLEIFIQAAIRLKQNIDNSVEIVLLLNNNTNIDEYNIPETIKICRDAEEKMKYLQTSRLGIIKSGTSTLEAAYYGLPMVVGYKLNPVSYFIIKNTIKVKFASIINIMAQKEIIPEFLQDKMTTKNIYNKLVELYKNPEQQIAQTQQYIDMLKPPEGKFIIKLS